MQKHIQVLKDKRCRILSVRLSANNASLNSAQVVTV